MNVKGLSIWTYSLSECIVGKRGFIKMAHGWLPLALIMATHPVDDLRRAYITSLYLIVGTFCFVMACICFNDISDREEDGEVGKLRWISHVSLHSGLFIVLCFIGVGLSSLICAQRSAKAILFYLAAIVIGLLYSLKNVRFKARGALGLFTYALSATLCYVVVPWICFGSSLVLLALLISAVMLDKWVNLLFHQIIDYHADLRKGCQTYAVKVGLARSRHSLQVFSQAASISLISVLIFITFLAKQGIIWGMIISLLSIVTLAAVWLYARNVKKSSEQVSDLIRELPWIYLGLTYLLFYIMPSVIFVSIAFKEQGIWIVFVLSCISLFEQSLYSIKYQYE